MSACLRLPLVDILLMHIPRHTKVCYFAILSLTNQHISSSQVTMDDLVKKEKKANAKAENNRIIGKRYSAKYNVFFLCI